MRGRGLIIAAAVLQLIGAALAILAGAYAMTMSTLITLSSVPAATDAMHLVGIIDATLGSGMAVVAIFLLQRRRWAWWVSLVFHGLLALCLLAMPIVGIAGSRAFGIGFGEMIVLGFLGAHIFDFVAFLLGGRQAVFEPSPKTAAPPLATPPGA